MAEHVNDSRISAFCTGGPGRFVLQLHDGAPDEERLRSATGRVRLGIEVRDRTLCFRDLYDFIRWDPECPDGQSASLEDGFYFVDVSTTRRPPDETQVVWLRFERSETKPDLAWTVVPDISGPDPSE